MGGRGSSSGFGSYASKINVFESENYNKSSESGLLIMSDGTAKRFGGLEHAVIGATEDIKRMNGGIFTHNHPLNVTFSDTDIRHGIVSGNLKELRAVTSSGEIHSLKNNGATLDERRKFCVGFEQAWMKASNVANGKIYRGEVIDEQQYVSKRMEKYMEENASKYHMTYEKRHLKRR